MKLLTLNCHSWQEENQLEKIKYLAETIYERDYDVVALQEVSQHRESQIIYGNIREDNFALLLVEELKKLGTAYNFIWDFSHYGYDIYEEGVALLSKQPFTDVQSFYISQSEGIENWKSRKIIGGSVEFKGEAYSFYSCHTGWWSDAEEPFRYQGEKILEISKNTDNKVFFMGDFNNDANIIGEGYEFLIKNGLTDTFTAAKIKDDGCTVPGEIAGWEDDISKKRLDLILAGTPVEVYSSNVIFNGKNKNIISDHFGVEIIL
ncbi:MULTISPECIES: endonuclease/exonuclease/phosphatase family protein [Psychrilyobacter]|uniref:Endonuclease n=1 Tax=Psychrilyobacter piezotolerans TaxID=2293438 RepID=A0ABX9KG66_9FUSO|nr:MULTISPECIES: endonuclease/exonuclease/phosphatase family protein [Psychrilyobacter]MCS5420446.1 endonuclease/exonuclease/phosphatase family protein [Psychrilyobacter sp. S5]NDI78225.1 endonuclease/exonuclease/phosphatase family protein [Psychrilyobacter piezotolerans]RDE61214.1 endonuclease [Psychrilyobacter sp. S5]REI40882.1 endonuclease [Psychrilyobacter piezotolerans]